MTAREATIGAYRILSKIGEGGMGVVYLGEHALLGRRAAIKVLLPSLSANEEIVTRFFNEARVVALISDPGIVQIFDFGYHTDGSAFIIMELLDGEPMDTRLKRIRRFGLVECLRLMQLICTALGAAHAKGVIHRDLKPGNIFILGEPAVVGDARVKILDFGIAKLSGDIPGKPKTRAGMLMGTPAYMSPEQCRCAGDIDPRSDIYSIACVMFAMLTGRPPFGTKAPGDLVASHLREPPPLASSRIAGLPTIVDHILQRCLKKSPAERFQSMTELVQALEFAERTLSRSSTTSLAAAPSRVFARPEPNAPEPGPTTLNVASGQSITPVAVTGRTEKRKPIVSLLLGAILFGSSSAIVVSRCGGGTSSPVVRSAGSTARADIVAAHVESPTIDAGPAPEPSFDPAIEDIGPALPAVRDAGVPSTPLPTGSNRVAVPRSHQPKASSNGGHQPNAEDKHASPNKPDGPSSVVPSHIDLSSIDPSSIDRSD